VWRALIAQNNTACGLSLTFCFALHQHLNPAREAVNLALLSSNHIA